jgi:hypothetical protein
VGGVEHGDDHDREQIVDHRQGQQERTQRRRQATADHRENGQRKSDISGGGIAQPSTAPPTLTSP